VYSNFVPDRAYSVNARRLQHRSSRGRRSERAVAIELTREASWVVVLLSSLGFWAVTWAAVAALVSAKFQ
jgi:hypothetical protein